MILDEVSEHAVEEENYFVSMSDMMAGLVFIFVILMMYYALQIQDVTDQLTGANQTRTEILKQLEQTLKEKGVDVTIDTQNGVLRLPDSILFDSGRPDLKPEGKVAVALLAEALADVLPCYTNRNAAPSSECSKENPKAHWVESVYVEGHTDADRYAGSGALRDNWDLSVVRATNTYRALVETNQGLAQLCSRKAVRGKCEAILSVSGYGPERPIAVGTDESSKRSNRRIDLRLVMVAPDAGETVAAVSSRIAKR